MERADVVHVWADVRVRRVKGRLRPHRGVPLGRYPDEGDVGESRTSRQRRRPAGRQRRFSQTSTLAALGQNRNFNIKYTQRIQRSFLKGEFKNIFCIFQIQTKNEKSKNKGDFRFLFNATFGALLLLQCSSRSPQRCIPAAPDADI